MNEVNHGKKTSSPPPWRISLRIARRTESQLSPSGPRGWRIIHAHLAYRERHAPRHGGYRAAPGTLLRAVGSICRRVMIWIARWMKWGKIRCLRSIRLRRDGFVGKFMSGARLDPGASAHLTFVWNSFSACISYPSCNTPEKTPNITLGWANITFRCRILAHRLEDGTQPIRFSLINWLASRCEVEA